MTSTTEEVESILSPGVERVEDPQGRIDDAMNLLGRVVAAVELLARRIDELSEQQPSIR